MAISDARPRTRSALCAAKTAARTWPRPMRIAEFPGSFGSCLADDDDDDDDGDGDGDDDDDAAVRQRIGHW